MIERINRAKAPFYVQFELTEKCNNKCYFCYNPLGHVTGNELTTNQIKNILEQLREMNVFRAIPHNEVCLKIRHPQLIK